MMPALNNIRRSLAGVLPRKQGLGASTARSTAFASAVCSSARSLICQQQRGTYVPGLGGSSISIIISSLVATLSTAAAGQHSKQLRKPRLSLSIASGDFVAPEAGSGSIFAGIDNDGYDDFGNNAAAAAAAAAGSSPAELAAKLLPLLPASVIYADNSSSSSPASPKTPSATETQPSGSGAVPLAAASPTAPSLPPGDGQAAAPQDAFCGQLTASGKTMLVYSSAVQEAGNWRGAWTCTVYLPSGAGQASAAVAGVNGVAPRTRQAGSSSSSSNNNVTPKNAFCGQMTASGKTMLVYNTAAQHAGSWRDACTCTVYLPSGGAL